MASFHFPFDVQTIMWQHLRLVRGAVRRVRPIVPLPTSTYSFQYTSQASSAPSFFEPAPSLPTFPNPTPIIFEEGGEEYENVPQSSMDLSKTARTTDEALVALLKDANYAEADIVLLEGLRNRQTIQPRLNFFVHALELLRQSTDSHWMAWFEVSPPYNALQKTRLEGGSSINRRRRQFMRLVASSVKDLAELEKIGLLAARKGWYMLVARYIMPKFSEYGSLEGEERVWQACLEGFESQNGFQGLIEGPPQRAAWDDLCKFRQQAICTHGMLGRYDTMVQLLESTRSPDAAAIGRIHVRKYIYLYVLALCASANRFDLFDRVYKCFSENQNRLLPQLPPKPGRPYVCRSIHNRPSVPLTSSEEAFTTFREHAHHHGESRAFRFNEEVRSAMESGDHETAMRMLLECFRLKDTPSLDTSALVVQYALQNNHTEFVESLTSQLAQTVLGAKLRSYCLATLMMAYIRERQFAPAISLFSKHVNLSTFPEVIQRSLRSSSIQNTETSISVTDDHFKLLLPVAHTFCLAMQAVVNVLFAAEQRAKWNKGSGAKENATVDELYGAISTSGSNFIVMPRRSQILNSPLSLGDGSDHQSLSSRCKLDPYTFVPFMQYYAKDEQAQAPSKLAQVIIDMHALELQPSHVHWKIFLRCLASQGMTDDCICLLGLMEGLHLSDDLPQPSDLLEKVLSKVQPASMRHQPSSNIIAYNGTIRGLTLAQEYEGAREIQRMMEKFMGNDCEDHVYDALLKTLERLDDEEMKNGWISNSRATESSKQSPHEAEKPELDFLTEEMSKEPELTKDGSNKDKAMSCASIENEDEPDKKVHICA